MSEQFIKSLSGHSGCDISLYSNNGTFFVRKSAGDAGYNRRLMRQMLKQSTHATTQDVIRAPRVLGRQMDSNGLFYFDMEYVRTRTLAEYMHSITVKEIVRLINLLFDWMPVSHGTINPDASRIFASKISSLYKSFTNITPIEQAAFDILNQFDFSKIPTSPCHGDLTLENILITSDNQLYLIDFLDSFYDSWMIDVAKLLQDLDIFWSYRHIEMSPNLSIRLMTAKNALIENMMEAENGTDNLVKIYHILLLNILRIVPYTKDDITKEFLQNALHKTLNTIKTLGAK